MRGAVNISCPVLGGKQARERGRWQEGIAENRKNGYNRHMKSVLQTKAAKTVALLSERFPGAECELAHENPFQLLVATILSAQCTDERVNKITPALFARFATPQALAAAPLPQVEKLIYSCGFYKNKAKNIVSMSARLVSEHNGQVPPDLDSLSRLPGVGRKTASVVSVVAFGIPAMPVDTHVFRVSRRLGLARGNSPEAVEKELCALLPKKDWGRAHHVFIWHGRRICHARKPACAECPVSGLCDYFKEARE